MWFLDFGFSIPDKHLKRGIQLAKAELNGENSGWSNFEERKQQLAYEIFEMGGDRG